MRRVCLPDCPIHKAAITAIEAGQEPTRDTCSDFVNCGCSNPDCTIKQMHASCYERIEPEMQAVDWRPREK